MVDECKWIRPMSVDLNTKSNLFTWRYTKLATLQMSEDDCEKYYVDFEIPGTILKKHGCLRFVEDINEAERGAVQLIREQLDEWIELCQEFKSQLPVYGDG